MANYFNIVIATFLVVLQSGYINSVFGDDELARADVQSSGKIFSPMSIDLATPIQSTEKPTPPSVIMRNFFPKSKSIDTANRPDVSINGYDHTSSTLIDLIFEPKNILRSITKMKTNPEDHGLMDPEDKLNSLKPTFRFIETNHIDAINDHYLDTIEKPMELPTLKHKLIDHLSSAKDPQLFTVLDAKSTTDQSTMAQDYNLNLFPTERQGDLTDLSLDTFSTPSITDQPNHVLNPTETNADPTEGIDLSAENVPTSSTDQSEVIYNADHADLPTENIPPIEEDLNGNDQSINIDQNSSINDDKVAETTSRTERDLPDPSMISLKTVTNRPEVDSATQNFSIRNPFAFIDDLATQLANIATNKKTRKTTSEDILEEVKEQDDQENNPEISQTSEENLNEKIASEMEVEQDDQENKTEIPQTSEENLHEKIASEMEVKQNDQENEPEIPQISEENLHEKIASEMEDHFNADEDHLNALESSKILVFEMPPGEDIPSNIVTIDQSDQETDQSLINNSTESDKILEDHVHPLETKHVLILEMPQSINEEILPLEAFIPVNEEDDSNNDEPKTEPSAEEISHNDTEIISEDPHHVSESKKVYVLEMPVTNSEEVIAQEILLPSSKLNNYFIAPPKATVPAENKRKTITKPKETANYELQREGFSKNLNEDVNDASEVDFTYTRSSQPSESTNMKSMSFESMENFPSKNAAKFPFFLWGGKPLIDFQLPFARNQVNRLMSRKMKHIKRAVGDEKPAGNNIIRPHMPRRPYLDENSVERIDRFHKDMERVMHFAQFLAHIDSYFTKKLKSGLKQIAKLVDSQEEQPVRTRRYY